MKLRSRKRWRWPHGFTDWTWDPVLGCWFHKGHTAGHDYYCLGDRMVHGTFGGSRGDISYVGSYVENWHGGIQTKHLEEALAWLREANGMDAWAWSR